MRSLAIAAALFASVMLASPAVALPPPDYQVTAQSEELRFNPVADLATDDGFAVVAFDRASTLDHPALTYEAALFFEIGVDGTPKTMIGAFDPIDPGRMYIA